ncbi:hypothetical protein [Paraburkholderia acidisoli]|uniref:Uncharacterized protein n=1 Tax=Paraburkholderia acidisoli TaxID=2571748 RepID=A0A7Z2JFU0_9BURK|nr:hypothetical protein [Paraburkholderia acidisoli]QGZ63096.1 hypothetical protein FAZ98_14840 [Paraburkholderia acidisoli]
MKRWQSVVAIALLGFATCARPYTIKTYHGAGASRVEACSLAKASALSPHEEVAHGRMLKVSRCECNQATTSPPWHCLVQSVHDK